VAQRRDGGGDAFIYTRIWDRACKGCKTVRTMQLLLLLLLLLLLRLLDDSARAAAPAVRTDVSAQAAVDRPRHFAFHRRGRHMG